MRYPPTFILWCGLFHARRRNFQIAKITAQGYYWALNISRLSNSRANGFVFSKHKPKGNKMPATSKQNKPDKQYKSKQESEMNVKPLGSQSAGRERSKAKNPGDVFAIPLGDNRFGFGLCFKNSLCGIYQHIGSSIEDLPTSRKFQFLTAISKPSLNSAEWILVGFDELGKSSKTELPSQFISDGEDGPYAIYDAKSDVDSPATKEECFGLEEVAAWSGVHIVQRLLSGGRHPWLSKDAWVPYGVEYRDDGSFVRFDILTGELK